LNASALDLIARLRELGVKLSIDGEDLVVDAPQGVINAELAAQIRERKVQIVAMLKWSARSRHSGELPLEAAGRDQPLPLSYSQQRLWFLDQLEPDSAAYNISWTVRLKGELHRDALQTAVDTLVARHEVLRTAFPAAGGDPSTLIAGRVSVPLECSVLPDAGDEKLRAHLSRLAATPFDLSKPPLVRVFLVERSPHEHVLLVLIHHIISDGASMRVLFRELAECYDACLEKREPALPELELQYADYALWQRRWLEGEQLDEQLGYWTEKLRGAPPLLTLPADRPRAAASRFRGAAVLQPLPRALAEGLRGLGRETGATLFMVMLAAFDALLHRYTGQDDLVVGTPLGGRPRTSLEGLIGFFVNTAVLRVQLQPESSFRDLIRSVRDTALEMHLHQELPFEKLVEAVQPQRELSHTPVFQVMFDLQEEPRWQLPAKGLEVIPEMIFSSRTSTFDLTLSVREAGATDGHGLDAMFEYDTDLFDEATIQRFAGHYQRLLEAALQTPDVPLSELSFIGEDEAARLLQPAGTVADAGCTLHSLVDAAASRNPQAVAIRAAGDDLSYQELRQQSDDIARRLIAAGVQPGSRVGLCTERSADGVLALLGILKAGAAWVPLDPAFPAGRLQAMAGQAGTALIIATGDPGGAATLAGLMQLADLPAATDTVLPDVAAANAACVLFTSGSSGLPKGVELVHSGLVNYIGQLRAKTGLDATANVLQFASLNFDISIEETFAALTSEATLVLRDAGPVPSVQEFFDACTTEHISWVSLPTAYWHELAAALDGSCAVPAGLKTVIIGGEKAQTGLWQRWQAQAGTVQLLNTYGPTEASIVSTWVDLTHATPDEHTDIPIGTAVPGVAVYVLDESRQLQPTGVPGELCIGGIGVAAGYLDSRLNDGVFIDNPFGEGRLYRSGDRARLRADGTLEFLGRIDEQLKWRGHRVEPAEIEAALLMHPDVDACAVMLRDDAGPALLVAYVAMAGGDAAATDLRAWLQERIPDYLVPDTFAVLDALPLTVNGKVDKAALPAPQRSAANASDYRAPATEDEQSMCAIWAAVLGIERVGLDDNFFDLGGHSLLATRVIARVQDVFGKSVPLRLLFNQPTAAGLLAAVARASAGGGRPVRPRRGNDLPPLSFSQQRLWFLDQMESGNATFNLPWMARLEGELNQPALQQAVNELVARHEVLRTGFIDGGDEPVQMIAPALKIPLQLEEHLAASDGALRARLRELVATGFDLRQPPLLRVHVLKVADDDHVLLLVMHHIVTDGWSMGVIYRELSELYNAACSRRAATLAGLPVQYADYALWQREQLESRAFGEQLQYWQTTLQDMPPLLELYADYERPAVQSYRGRWSELSLQPELAGGLKQLAADKDSSLFMLLLTAFNVLLGRYAGREDIVVGTSVAGRRRTEIESLIGFFLNTVVLRTDLSGNPQFSALLERVRQQSLAAFDHQDVPFEKLIELLQPERDPAYPPLVQVMFNVHNEPAVDVRFDNATVSPFVLDSGTAKFDLNVAVHERGERLLVGIEYNSDLFSRGTIEDLLQAYQQLLQAVAADPEQRLTRLPLPGGQSSSGVITLGGQDTAKLKVTHNVVTGWDSLLTRIIEQARHDPFACAVDDGATQYSYAQLFAPDIHKTRLTLKLQGRKSDSTRLAVLCSHDASAIVAMLTAMRLNFTWVALDPNAPLSRLQDILSEADVAGVLYGPGHESLANKLSDTTVAVPLPGPVDAAQWQQLETELADYVLGEKYDVQSRTGSPMPDDLAYILFTSGTTGKPKGVPQTHRNVLAHSEIYSQSISVTAADRLSMFAGPGFDAGIMDVFAALTNGACLCPVDISKESQPLATALQRGVTVLHSTPTVFRLLMSEPAELPATLHTLVLGGEEAVRQDYETFAGRFAEGSRFVNGLGPSESTTALQFVANTAARLPAGILPVGRAVQDTVVYLQDKHGNPSAFCGEITLRSDRLTPGYWRDEALTKQAFPRSDTYRSGDTARYLPDGNLVFTGRNDGQVKLSGVRIETAEVEAMLTAQDGVKRSLVLLDNATGSARLLAWYQAAFDIDESLLRSALRERLPASMVPQRFCRVAEFPLTPNGKLDKQALPLLPAAAAVKYRPPVSPTQLLVASVWQQLLDVEPGLDDDFFALGGHSLLATRVAAQLRERLGVSISLRLLFDHPVLEGLAAVIETLARDDSAPLVALPDAERQVTPLSWSQQRLWFLDQLEPGNPAYNLHRAVRIRGSVSAEGLQAAVDELVQRQASLRTVFAASGGEPVQLLMPQMPVPVEVLNMKGAAEEQLRERLLGIIRAPFDLSAGPLLRVVLLEAAADESVLLLMMHHIISDGWSMGVLSRELSALVHKHAGDNVAALPELPVQYPDYSVWQRQWLSGSELEQQLEYWRERLADVPPVLELPLDKPRPPVPSSRGAWRQLRLDNDQLAALHSCAAENGATLFMTLLAAFNVVLARYTGREDMVIGTPVAGRQRAEVENLIGFFLNTLVMRTDLSGDPDFQTILARTKETALGAFDHQNVPFEKLIEELQPARSLSTTPLVQVMFNLHNEQEGDIELGESNSVFHLDRGTAKFDLNMALAEGSNGLLIAAEYNTDIFAAETIDALLARFAEIIDTVVAQPDMPLSRLLVKAPVYRLPRSRTSSTVSKATDVVSAFAEQVAERPDALAVVTNTHEWSFAELDARSNRVANDLLAVTEGQNIGCNVGLMLGHDAPMLAGLVGALRAGKTYVPLDPDAPDSRLQELTVDAQLTALISDALNQPRAAQVAAAANVPLVVVADSPPEACVAAPAINTDPEQLAYVLFTSGSTGKPKGVMQTHANVMHHARAYCGSLGINSSDRLSLLSPYGFDAAVMDIYACLISGACLRPFDLKNEVHVGAVIAEIGGSDITVLHATPTVFRYLMRHKICRHDVTKVRAVVLGGEEAKVGDFEFFKKNFDEQAVFVNGLGPSECTVALQWLADHDTELTGGLVPAGQPVSGVEVLLLDEQQQVSAISGEIVIACDAVTPGYWQRDDLTADAFINQGGKRWYRTGDRGRYLPDGNLLFAGRVDEQIKLRGHRIEPGEIEAALLDHERVDRAVVLLRNDLQGNARLVSWVVAKKQQSVETGELREHIKGRLPRYMLPSAIEVLEGLPLTVNGKVDRKALPDPKWGRNEDRALVVPRNETEQQVAAIWRDVLAVPEIGVEDDFFELGGHSLLAMQLLARISDSLQVGLPLRKLFDGPTVADLAKAIDDVRWAVGPGTEENVSAE